MSKDNLILRAGAFAKQAHGNQKRKYSNFPYITHPARIAGRVIVHKLATPEMIAAAFCHDVVEDTPVSIEEIDDEFGFVVANYVKELTNCFTKEKYPHLNRDTRKNLEHDRLSKISTETKVIKLLDRIDNLGEVDLHDSFAQVFAKESRDLLKAVGDADSELSQELTHLILFVENT